MSDANATLTTEPPLDDYTEEVKKNRSICWYRTKLPPGELKKLHQKSDLKAAWQTFGYLFLLVVPFATAVWAVNVGHWWLAVLGVIFYGMFASFLINAVHELVHGTVFKTKWLNSFFCHFFAFLGWINHENFGQSHVRHHRYTLHPPDDLEVKLPIRLAVKGFLKTAFFNWAGLKWKIRNTFRVARGKFQGDWELTLFPPDEPEKRKPVVRWARCILVGHGLILVASVLTGQYLIPLLLIVGPSIASGPFWLCNNTQHVGLTDQVGDFRLCCRTFTLNPFLRFLYWQMNYHIEHHMYAAVPCYHLDRLHRLIRHDLPPTPHGLVETWREIGEIMKRQEAEPGYQYRAPLPQRSNA